MKTKLLILCFLSMCVNKMFSQSFCLTESNSSNLQYNYQVQSRSTKKDQFFDLRVYFHVIRKTDGTGGQSRKNVEAAYNILNEDFTPHRISFNWDQKIDYIDNDYYFNTPDSSIFYVNNHQNGIDIYLYDDGTSFSGGLAHGVGSSSELFIAGRDWNPPFQSFSSSHVISHEMGHVLFLWHTHHGTVKEISNDNQCAELVDGSNATTCGDYVEDTPADPLISNTDPRNCEWHGSERDANGDLYKPDTHLIMSYTPASCMEYFSQGQAERMRNAIETLPHLQKVIVKVSTSISGPSKICDQGVYSIERLPIDATIQWGAEDDGVKLTAGQGTNTATFSWNKNGYSTITARIEYEGEIYLIKKRIQVGVYPMSFELYDETHHQTVSRGKVNTLYYFYVPGGSTNGNDYRWWIISKNSDPRDSINYMGGDKLYFVASQSGPYQVYLSYKRDCGIWSDKLCNVYYFDDNSVNFQLIQEQNTDVITLQFDTVYDAFVREVRSKGSKYEIQLWSSRGMINKFKTDQLTFQIPIGDLTSGIYFIRVIKNGQVSAKKFIKK